MQVSKWGNSLAVRLPAVVVEALGLKEGALDVAMDEHNARLVTPAMKARVDAAKADIIAGKIKVHDYMSDNSCKY